MKIKLTKEAVEYIKTHDWEFSSLPKIPEEGEEWELEGMAKYPAACEGKPVVELKNDEGWWMRLPARLFFNEKYAEHLIEKGYSL